MADTRAAESEAAIRRAEEVVATTKERAATIEARAVAAERRFVEAVNDFRKSTNFANELAKASVDLYLQGFQDGKEKVAKAFGLPGVEGIEPDEELEGSSTAPRATDNESALAEP